MISEAFIKKVAREELGTEGIDWFYSVEKGHEKWIRRIEVICDCCGSTFHVLFDLRETTDENSRYQRPVGLGVRRRIRQLKKTLHGIIEE